ncbi:MAG: glutamine synthetase, partial [Anaerolinea sp.]|nr:glutamine synthetase [Anaerolinea sp.]
GKNLFWDANGQEKISPMAWDFLSRILNHGLDICLILNSSVNSYRRLDPNYEAPNQIKASPIDRSSMIRIPFGNERSARIEVRSIAPDANPYLAIYTLFRTGLEGTPPDAADHHDVVTLPDNIYDALDDFNNSELVKHFLGEEVATKYSDLKREAADRCPRQLGSLIKSSEIQYHHEVYNQRLWKMF